MVPAMGENRVLVVLVVVTLVVSGIQPFDRTTWWLEIAPILVGLPLLVVTHRTFPLTGLAYRLLFVHAVVSAVGGHYTYARVPVGAWLQQALDLSRNHYDRVGHLVQGFVPAIVVREVLLRKTPLGPGLWLFVLVTCVCLAVSAGYEIVEWWAALVLGESASAFLGTQGDMWDTQWDMFLALLGALIAQLSLSRAHDRALVRVARPLR